MKTDFRDYIFSKAWIILLLLAFSLFVGIMLANTNYASSYIAYPYQLFLVFLLCFIFGTYFFKTKKERDSFKEKTNHPINRKIRKKHIWLLIVSVTIVYISVSLLLYSAWMKDDEFLFAYKRESFLQHIYFAFNRYTFNVSRIGDLLICLFPLDSSRWQVFIITPLVPALTPFAIYKLVSERNETIFSFSGLIFYWLNVALLLMCVYLSSWRSYYCYAANANYLWPSAILILFLSFYNKSHWYTGTPNQYGSSFLLFVFGLLTAWGQECLTVILVPGLTFWFTYHLYKKKHIPNSCFWGYIGTIVGAFMLFAAPALNNRLVRESCSRTMDVSSMSDTELTLFLHSLDWDKINLLKGSSNVINLHDIPYFDRVHFIPFLLERYWECCQIVIIVFLALFVIYIVYKSRSNERKFYWTPIVYAFCSLLTALSYSVSCIPGRWSFTICGFLLVIACAFMAQKINREKKYLIITSLLTCIIIYFALQIFVPAGIEAYKLKKYEQIRTNEIIKQKNNGIEHIKLNYPLPCRPTDSLGLIGIQYMKEDSTYYTNYVAAQFYKVKSIIQYQYKRSSAAKKTRNCEQR